MRGSADILVVDDEPAMRDLITGALERAGFVHQQAGDTEEARASILANPPDLILLDWMLPGRSGVEFVRDLRGMELTRTIPVILLTARSEERDRIHGFNVGADDFVTKPFSVGELIARIKAVLRRTSPDKSTEVIEAKGLCIYPESHRVAVNNHFIEISPTEFRLLHFLMANPERVFTRAQIIDEVWGPRAYVGDRTVDVHVRSLRKALTPSGHHALVQTVRGTGYRFSERG